MHCRFCQCCSCSAATELSSWDRQGYCTAHKDEHIYPAFHRDSLPVPTSASSHPLCPKTRPVLFSCFNPLDAIHVAELTFPMSSCGRTCSSSRLCFKCRSWRRLHCTPRPRRSDYIPWPRCGDDVLSVWPAPRMEGRVHLLSAHQGLTEDHHGTDAHKMNEHSRSNWAENKL